MIRAGIMVCSDRLTIRSNRDRVGRRSILAMTSSIPEAHDTSLIFVGYSYAGYTRLFSQMYRRICGAPFKSDKGAKSVPRPEDILAIDVRFLWPPDEEEEPDTTGPDTGAHDLPAEASCTVYNNPRPRHHRRRDCVLATL